MRSADFATIFRVGLIVVSAYMIITKFMVWLAVVIMAIAFLLDGFDGFLAVREQSRGQIGFLDYVRAALGNSTLKEKVKKVKQSISMNAPHGARMDVAGDRATEYILWGTFTYLNILPFIVLVIVIIRHSFVDAVMGVKGTSAKMKTRFARMVYSSNIARGGVNVVKFLTFAYLALAFAYGYPIIIGYALTVILLVYILLRGSAEIYESFA